MGWTPEAVFDLDSDVIEFPKELIREYEFTLKGISIPVRIRLYKVFGHEGVLFAQSHHIKTPTQIGKYVTSRPWNDDLGSALWQAVTGITRYYKEAVAAGHSPSDDWLVPNECF
jgi:hypothetical protein